jgi:penicillin amidase
LARATARAGTTIHRRGLGLHGSQANSEDRLLRINQVIGFALLASQFAVEAARRPLPDRASVRQRLDMVPKDGIPLKNKVVLHCNEHQVPFIEASTDADLATALGLVHAHLRLGQMEMVRRAAQGRLAEMIGPLGIDLDYLVRVLNIDRAVPEILSSLPGETRSWIEAFVKGINHYLDAASELPYEFAALHLRREPWSVTDILTIGRLVAADANWLVWWRLVKLRGRKGWPEIWRRLLGNSHRQRRIPNPIPPSHSYFESLLSLVMRQASNSLAIAPSRSISGGALLASDPHLGLHLPNAWLVVGYRSPSHHAVGLMPAGLPFIALGRNPWIAWGGANLHAVSSDFVDVSELPENAIIERREVIKVRWWTERSITLRDTPYGPIISDARVLGLDDRTPIALRWMGHLPSDEITAMLRVSQARDWDQFRAALNGVSVSGQRMIYADIDGRIGQAMAVKLPRREQKALSDLVVKSGIAENWDNFVIGSDLPATLHPKEGFVVSANERPGETAVPVGLFFSASDRAQRLADLVSSRSKISRQGLSEMMMDVSMATSLEINKKFLTALGSEQADPRDKDTAPLMATLAGWDGRYDAGSTGALAFELVFCNFVRSFYGEDERKAYWATWAPRTLVNEDLLQCLPADIASVVKQAIRRSFRIFDSLGTWGQMHRLRMSHPFGLMPILGKRYIYCDVPMAGGNESLLKTGHRLTTKRHSAVFGSSARHVSDLSDMDANFFVLAGGQDGWLGSSTYADQLDLWRRGAYLRVPLQPKTVRACFPYRVELSPRPVAERP